MMPMPGAQFQRHRMYHASKPPIEVTTPQQQNEATRDGYQNVYIHQAWPKMLYHETEEPKVFANQKEYDAALKAGWSKEVVMVCVDPTGNPNGLHVPRAPQKQEASK